MIIDKTFLFTVFLPAPAYNLTDLIIENLMLVCHWLNFFEYHTEWLGSWCNRSTVISLGSSKTTFFRLTAASEILIWFCNWAIKFFPLAYFASLCFLNSFIISFIIDFFRPGRENNLLHRLPQWQILGVLIHNPHHFLLGGWLGGPLLDNIEIYFKLLIILFMNLISN